MKQTCEYCTVQGIPFPSYNIQDDDKNLQECYLMGQSQDPDVPIVAFFPLINDTFQKYEAPGELPPCSVPSPCQPQTESANQASCSWTTLAC